MLKLHYDIRKPLSWLGLRRHQAKFFRVKQAVQCKVRIDSFIVSTQLILRVALVPPYNAPCAAGSPYLQVTL